MRPAEPHPPAGRLTRTWLPLRVPGAAGDAGAMSIEVHDGVTAEVGRMQVRRVLPRRRLRTIGAWCFADHMGPAEVTETAGLDVGPHPHTGLQTVTWLMEGAVLHRDSLGSEQLIRPGQVNLMTAGRGVVHAEENSGTYRGTLQGMQLWVAQPDDVRHGDPGFAHHADLPVVEWDRASATLIAGSYLGATSPAAFATELLGMQVTVQPGVTTFPLRPDFEHAIIALDGPLLVGDEPAAPRAAAKPGQIAALPARTLRDRRGGPRADAPDGPRAASRSRSRSSCGGTSWPATPTRSRRSTPIGATTGNASATSTRPWSGSRRRHPRGSRSGLLLHTEHGRPNQRILREGRNLRVDGEGPALPGGSCR